jgi:hypothetical protein
MKQIKQLIFMLALSIPNINANAGWFGPSSYDECIADKMRGITEPVGQSAVIRLCRDKFSDRAFSPAPALPPSPPPKKVTTEECEALNRQFAERHRPCQQSGLGTLERIECRRDEIRHEMRLPPGCAP